MSRIAKYPVSVPDKVQVTVDKSKLVVKGPLGTLEQAIGSGVAVKVENGKVTFAATDETKEANALSGTLRATVANMVHGVKEGFSKKLTLVGVGYRAQAQGNKLNLSLGFSHPIVHALPDGGQVAAEVRGYKPPEPYKGKGVRYADERVTLKETKKK